MRHRNLILSLSQLNNIKITPKSPFFSHTQKELCDTIILQIHNRSSLSMIVLIETIYHRKNDFEIYIAIDISPDFGDLFQKPNERKIISKTMRICLLNSQYH